MKVTDHLARASGPLISFEIIPPLRGGNLQNLLGLIEELVTYNPPFIDITSHAAEVVYDETGNDSTDPLSMACDSAFQRSGREGW